MPGRVPARLCGAETEGTDSNLIHCRTVLAAVTVSLVRDLPMVERAGMPYFFERLPPSPTRIVNSPSDGAGATRSRCPLAPTARSEEHTSELQSLMRISYAVFCLKKKTKKNKRQA